MELLALTAVRSRVQMLMQVALAAVLLGFSAGCSVKKTVKVKVSPSILQAKSATFDELCAILSAYDSIRSLSSNSLRITLTSGKLESGELRKYASAPGYILLQRPNSTRLVVQYPVTKTTLIDLISVDDEFCVWVPKENKYYIGKNSARELVVEDLPDSPSFSMRATHIFEAIMPQIFVSDSNNIFFESSEELSSEAKYYVFSVLKKGVAPRLHVLRKIWIERSRMTIARQCVYDEEGRVVSDIAYSDVIQTEGLALPLRVRIDRPLDGYSLQIEFKNWRVNPNLPDNAFSLPPPSGAQIVPFKEKGRSSVS